MRLTPAASRPSFSVAGLRPVAAITTSASSELPSSKRASSPAPVFSRERELRQGEERDPRLGEPRRQPRAQILVKAAQRQVGAITERDLRAEPRKKRREFDGDIAGAENEQALRKDGEIEDLVRGERELDSRNLGRQHRRAAGRDEDVARAQGAAVGEADGLRTLERGAQRKDLDAGLLEVRSIDALEPRDLALLGRDEPAPIELGLADAPAETSRVLEIVGVARRHDVELLGDAAANDASAAETEVFRNRDLGSVPRGDARRAHAARARADYEKVEVEFRHARPVSRDRRQRARKRG